MVKQKYDDDEEVGIIEFFVFSWTIDEYQRAIQDEFFYNSVVDNLDSSPLPEEDVKELISLCWWFFTIYVWDEDSCCT